MLDFEKIAQDSYQDEMNKIAEALSENIGLAGTAAGAYGVGYGVNAGINKIINKRRAAKNIGSTFTKAKGGKIGKLISLGLMLPSAAGYAVGRTATVNSSDNTYSKGSGASNLVPFFGQGALNKGVRHNYNKNGGR